MKKKPMSTMEEINIPDYTEVKNDRKFWKNLLRTILGTTISIILTFGTNSLILWNRKANDRKMTAMMVLSNI